MNLLFQICRGVSLGIIVGFLLGGIKWLHHPDYDQKQIDSQVKFYKVVSAVLKYFTFLCLILGLLWCIYYLVLGAWDPDLSGYATNMSQLIVSVLTIVSIIFAFFEFLQRKN